MNIIRQGPSLRKEEEESRKVDKEKLRKNVNINAWGRTRQDFERKRNEKENRGRT